MFFNGNNNINNINNINNVSNIKNKWLAVSSCKQRVAAILFSSSLLFSCGSDNSLPETDGSDSRKTSSVTLTGIVTDSIIVNASVEILIGDEIFQTTADSQGQYSTLIEVDEALGNNLVQIRALGDANLNAEVEFVSQLGSVASLVAQAGDDAILDVNDNFSVNITNVTTAEFALITRDANTPETDAELITAQALVDNNEKNVLAALIKIVVDNDAYGLPDGVTSTLDLVDDANTAESFNQQVTAQEPNLVSDTIEEILNDSDLTKLQSPIVGTWNLEDSNGTTMLAFTNSGYYLHMEQGDNDCGVLGYELGTYTWNQSTGAISVNTLEDTNGCIGLHDTTDEPLNEIRTLGISLIVTDDFMVGTEQETNEEFTFQRVINDSNAIIGGFVEGDLSDEFFFIAFLDSGMFVELAHDDDETGVSIGFYAWDVDSKILDFSFIIESQIGFDPYQHALNMHGDIGVWRDFEEAGVVKRVRTTTEQPYLTAANVIGSFSGVDDDSFEYSLTLNSDGSGEGSDVDGEFNLSWEIIFGQLVWSDNDYMGIASPTMISNEELSFSTMDFEIISDNSETNFYTEIWTRQ